MTELTPAPTLASKNVRKHIEHYYSIKKSGDPQKDSDAIQELLLVAGGGKPADPTLLTETDTSYKYPVGTIIHALQYNPFVYSNITYAHTLIEKDNA